MRSHRRMRAFLTWKDRVDNEKYFRKVADKAIMRQRNNEQSAAMHQWKESVHSMKAEREREEKQSMSQRLYELEQEKARLERDNERFVRLIDSGEWGKGRVEEIVKAGEAMRKERDEMQRLLKQMKEDYDSLQKRREEQDDDINGLKERLPSGNFMQRNKMLVRGSSHHNASSKAASKPPLETISSRPVGSTAPQQQQQQQSSGRQGSLRGTRQRQAPALAEEDLERLEARYGNNEGRRRWQKY